MEINFLEGVEILYYDDYWDGPLKGLCIHNKVYYYYSMSKDYECIDEDCDQETDREFAMYEITVRELANFLYWHSLFSSNVKQYTSIDKTLVFDWLKTNETFWDLSKKYDREKLNLKERKIVGYFRGINYYKDGN